jgi:hypothetical protein
MELNIRRPFRWLDEAEREQILRLPGGWIIRAFRSIGSVVTADGENPQSTVASYG